MNGRMDGWIDGWTDERTYVDVISTCALLLASEGCGGAAVMHEMRLLTRKEFYGSSFLRESRKYRLPRDFSRVDDQSISLWTFGP